MSVDLSRARIPFARRVAVPKKRTDEASDSVLASSRGDDLATTEAFTGLGAHTTFQSYTLTVGEGSPGDREPGVAYSVKIPDVDGRHVLLVNSSPIQTPIQKAIIEAGYVGDTTTELFIGAPLVVGSLAAFSLLTQTYVDPSTTPDELDHKVVEFLSGQFRFSDELLEGRIRFWLTGSMEVNTGANTTIQWDIESSNDDGANWNPLGSLARDSFSSVDTPEASNYKSRWFTHLQGTWYRLIVSRSAGPAGAMTLTAHDPVIEAQMDILKI